MADAPGVFASVCFHIVLSDKLPSDLATKLRDDLIANGATEHSAPSEDGLCTLDGLSHLIAANVDFAGYRAAEDRMIPVVNVAWIEASLAKKKLANPKSHSPDPRMFFSGMVVHMVGMPAGDTDAIIGAITAMGGLYSSALARSVTHIVTTDTNNDTCHTAQDKGVDCKIVLPRWIDDCLKLGKRIDEQPYMFPDPEVLITNGTAPLDLGHPTPDSSPLDHQTTLDVFKNRSICLSDDLCLSDRLRCTLEALIRKAEGRVSETVSDCDALVCEHRQGLLYAEAYQAGRTIGSLSWFYWMISHNAWTSPLKRLLHYPTTDGGIPGFRRFRICLSNYSGEARIYLENLAKAAGSEFTKTMKTDNTHLITSHQFSEKCDAAKEWGITIVNHLWLEESYARGEIQEASNPRYTHFPTLTNLIEVVGQTPVDKIALDLQFQRDYAEDTELDSDDADRVGLDGASDDPPKNANAVRSSPRTRTPTAKSGNISKEAAYTTPAPKKRRSMGKENEEPMTMSTGSRSAKAQAAAKLQDLASDIALYERERKRAGGVVFGGRRRARDLVDSADRKRPSPEPEDGAERPHKKSKNSKEPLRLRMLMTGVSKYDGHDKASAKLRDRLRELGILLTESENNCKYLIAPRILRTKKFVCAIAQAPKLVDPQFLDDCLEMEELLNPDDYPFQDQEGEDQYGLKMDEVLDRAATNRQKLLKDYTIWVTDNVHGGFDVYKSIIEINGGRCLPYQPRFGTIPRVRYDSDDEDETPEPAHLICGPDDSSLIERFKGMSEDAGRKPIIVANDWLLDLALSQEVVD